MKLERAARAVDSPPGRRRHVDLNAWVMVGVLIAMWAVLSILPATGGRFLTQANITNLMTQSAVLLVVSVGMTMVLLVRGIDLSVGAGVALSGVVLALAHQQLGLPAPLAIGAAIGCGVALGAWHGLWVAWLGVPAFVVTLAGLKMYRGGALVLSEARGLTLNQDFEFLTRSIPVAATWAIVGGALAIGIAITLRDARRRTRFGLEPTPPRVVIAKIAGHVVLAGFLVAVFGQRGIPTLVMIAGAVALWGMFVTTRTRFGRHLYAIGGNPEAARLSGIDVRRTTLWVYVILGVLTALAGVLLAARLDGVTASNQGDLLELNAVTAVVIGGTSLAGGRGSIVGTVLGTLVFATVANGMNALRIDSNWQLIFTGLILLAAVLIDVLSKGRRT